MTNLEPQKLPSLEALDQFTKAFIDSLQVTEYAQTIALSGDLGVGKTTFVQSLAKQLGVSEPITSPTFAIMKRYETSNDSFPTLFHMDAYRLESESEVIPLRLEAIFETPKSLFCIEWAERIANVLPENTIFLKLSIDEAGVHTIQREIKEQIASVAVSAYTKYTYGNYEEKNTGTP